MDTLSTVWNILKVAVGLGFVIFIHELGHFLLAKWNGVKVEKFSIGFGKTLFGFKKGETEYVLAAVPLGGFVKMLGEGEEGGENDEARTTDPRSFMNKPVGARMAIISAGVIMNLLLAVVCFSYAFGQEREKIAAKVGGVVAGSPAYNAGLRPGDEIIAIDGEGDVGFQDLMKVVNLSVRDQVVTFRVKRPGVEQPIDFLIEPKRDAASDRPTIGVTSGPSLDVGDYQPPAGTVDAPKFPWPPRSTTNPILSTIVSAAPAGESLEPIASAEELLLVSARNASKPLEITVEWRPLRSPPPGTRLEEPPGRASFTMPPNHFVDFGFRLEYGSVSAIQNGSPAKEAGFEIGDRILKVDGDGDFDPMRLASRCFDHAGEPMTFEVERTDKEGQNPLSITLTVTPDPLPAAFGARSVTSNEDLEIPSLGLSFPIKPVVAAVRPDSPAAKAGLNPGDAIEAMILPKTEGRPRGVTPEGESVWLLESERTLTLDGKTAAWPFAFGLVQSLPLQAVSLKIQGRDDPVSLTPEIDPEWFNPDRGLEFFAASRTLPPLPPLAALGKGWEETIDNVRMMYATIRSLFSGRVSPTNLGGPILIAQVAYSAANTGFAEFLYFLGFISINLAVLNFLPIPPLDGGQMVFLIAEKVRGRPLPDSALIAGTYLGLMMVLFLMVFATYQDIFRIIKSYFL